MKGFLYVGSIKEGHGQGFHGSRSQTFYRSSTEIILFFGGEGVGGGLRSGNWRGIHIESHVVHLRGVWSTLQL